MTFQIAFIPATIAAFLFLFSISATAQYTDYCFEGALNCDFRFRGTGIAPSFDFNTPADRPFIETRGTGIAPSFDFNTPADRPFTPRIYSNAPGENLGVINANIIEILDEDLGFQPITGADYTDDDGNHYSYEYADPNFSATHFKAFPLPDGGSGIGHETFRGGQLRAAQNRCFRIHFKNYQTLKHYGGPVLQDKDVPPYSSKCIVFWGKYPWYPWF